MAYVTYEEIKHMVDSFEKERGRVKVFFKCPKTGIVKESSGVIPQSMGNKVANEAAQGGIRHLLRMVSNMVRRTTGVYVPLGNTSSSTSLGSGRAFTSDEAVQAGVATAFEAVSVYPGKPKQREKFFKWDDGWEYCE